MLFLRLYAPKLSAEQKKIMGTELTETVASVLALSPAERECLAIYFMPYRLENVAVGGRLLSETEEPMYQLEFHSLHLDDGVKTVLHQRLQPLLMELMQLPPTEPHRMTLLFREYPAGDLPWKVQSCQESSKAPHLVPL